MPLNNLIPCTLYNMSSCIYKHIKNNTLVLIDSPPTDTLVVRLIYYVMFDFDLDKDEMYKKFIT